MAAHEVLFEGLREEEILNLPRETVKQLILLGEPLVFRIGSAVLLGSFKVDTDRLVIELAQIEGGGEGVLMALASLRSDTPNCGTCQRSNGSSTRSLVPNPISNCGAYCNVVGLSISQVAGVGEAYHLMDSV